MEKGAVGDCEARAAGDVGTADCGRGKGVRRAFAFPPFWVFGMGFYWAWLMVAFYTPVLTSNADGTPQFVQDIWTWSAWAHAATLLGCAVAGERAVRLGRRCSASVAVPLATALATALIPVGCLLAATSQPVAAVAVALGAIVAGVGTGFMVFMWSAVYLRADSTVSTWGIVGSYLLSSVLYVLVRLLPDGLALLAEVCLPLLSGFFLVRFDRLTAASAAPATAPAAAFTLSASAITSPHDEVLTPASVPSDVDPRPRPRADRPWRLAIPLSALLLYAFAGEVLRGFAVFTGDLEESLVPMGDLYVLGCAAGTAVFAAILLAARTRGAREARGMREAREVREGRGASGVAGDRGEVLGIRPVLMLMAAGFLVTAIFNTSFFVAYAIFGAAFQVCRVIVWLYSFDVVRRTGCSAVRVVGIAQGVFALAAAIGAPLSRTLVVSLGLGVAQWPTVALVAVFLIFGSAVLVLNPSDLSTAWGLVRGPRAGGGASGAGDATFPASPSSPASSPTSAAADPDPDPIAEVARAYGLSPRECDVARLLFKGRSLPFVMSELSIAKGTAETHLNHIYRKLGVHTRQEFITLVERVGAGGQNGERRGLS